MFHQQLFVQFLGIERDFRAFLLPYRVQCETSAVAHLLDRYLFLAADIDTDSSVQMDRQRIGAEKVRQFSHHLVAKAFFFRADRHIQIKHIAG